jgi:hypothetical protein
MFTRGYNKCLDPGKALAPNVYLPNQCYGQSSKNDYIESIAQARLVQTLDNAWIPGQAISRGIQWEANFSGPALASMTGLSRSALWAKFWPRSACSAGVTLGSPPQFPDFGG